MMMMLLPLSLISLGIVGARAAAAGPSGGGGVGAKACPEIHVFGARETTTPPGFGTSQTLIDLLVKRFPGTTAEAIVYPAAGGDEYGQSVGAGILAVVKQTATFAVKCPSSIIIMHGYSQVRFLLVRKDWGGP